MLKLAHAGLFCTEKDSVVPLGPLAVGWNEYGLPAMSVVAGVPEIVGGGGGVDEVELVGLASTCIANAGSVALFQPSLTPITMFEYVPTLTAEGMPEICPVPLLKLTHEGLLLIAKTRVRPDVSRAEGVNVYACPAATLVAGEPEIVT